MKAGINLTRSLHEMFKCKVLRIIFIVKKKKFGIHIPPLYNPKDEMHFG